MFMRAQMHQGSTTPNVEKSAGIRVAQHYQPAEYLPLLRFDQKLGEYKVISLGKVIATDWNNYVVPAGLVFDVEQALSSTTSYNDLAEFITNNADFQNIYNSTDVAQGVKNSQGEVVTDGEPVVASFFTGYDSTGVQLNGIGNALGITGYDIWRANGAGYGHGYEAGNPMQYRMQNWNPQQGLAILTRYFIELPVVADTSQVVLPGLSVFTGTPVVGGLVTYDAESNMCPFNGVADLSTGDTYTDAAVNAAIASVNKGLEKVLGKVYHVDTDFPKDYLNYVRTWQPDIQNASALDKAPGNATSGLPDNLSLAGVTDPASAKVVRINLLV